MERPQGTLPVTVEVTAQQLRARVHGLVLGEAAQGAQEDAQRDQVAVGKRRLRRRGQASHRTAARPRLETGAHGRGLQHAHGELQSRLAGREQSLLQLGVDAAMAQEEQIAMMSASEAGNEASKEMLGQAVLEADEGRATGDSFDVQAAHADRRQQLVVRASWHACERGRGGAEAGHDLDDHRHRLTQCNAAQADAIGSVDRQMGQQFGMALGQVRPARRGQLGRGRVAGPGLAVGSHEVAAERGQHDERIVRLTEVGIEAKDQLGRKTSCGIQNNR